MNFYLITQINICLKTLFNKRYEIKLMFASSWANIIEIIKIFILLITISVT